MCKHKCVYSIFKCVIRNSCWRRAAIARASPIQTNPRRRRRRKVEMNSSHSVDGMLLMGLCLLTMHSAVAVAVGESNGDIALQSKRRRHIYLQFDVYFVSIFFFFLSFLGRVTACEHTSSTLFYRLVEPCGDRPTDSPRLTVRAQQPTKSIVHWSDIHLHCLHHRNTRNG